MGKAKGVKMSEHDIVFGESQIRNPEKWEIKKRNKPKKTKFFKCQVCGVEFFIYTEREINETLCGECKKIKDASNYKRSYADG